MPHVRFSPFFSLGSSLIFGESFRGRRTIGGPKGHFFPLDSDMKFCLDFNFEASVGSFVSDKMNQLESVGPERVGFLALMFVAVNSVDFRS